VPAWLAFYLGNARSRVAGLLLLMVTMHSGGSGQSFFNVMEPQAVLIVVAGSPAVWAAIDPVRQ
jgi:hypothetical protein